MKTVVSSDGVSLAVYERGEGAPVLFLHGWMTSAGVFDGLLDALPGVRAITVDQRGAGKSAKPASGYSLQAYISDALSVVKELELDRVLIVGHSAGGQVAMGLAAAMGGAARGLVLINPVPPGGLELPADAVGLFSSAGGDREKLGIILGLATKDLAPAERERMLDLAMEVSPTCVAELFEAWSAGGIAHRLGRIRVPTLVVATEDPFLPTALLQETVADEIAGATLVEVLGAGHYPANERTAETAAVLSSFFAANP